MNRECECARTCADGEALARLTQGETTRANGILLDLPRRATFTRPFFAPLSIVINRTRLLKKICHLDRPLSKRSHVIPPLVGSMEATIFDTFHVRAIMLVHPLFPPSHPPLLLPPSVHGARACRAYRRMEFSGSRNPDRDSGVPSAG